MPNERRPKISLSISNSLRSNLKAKSRRRREELAALAAASAASYPARNDLVPKLQLVERAPGALVVPSRKLRMIEAVLLDIFQKSMLIAEGLWMHLREGAKQGR